MKILITGAAGVLGSRVAKALEDKHDVVLLDMFEVDTPHEFRQADLRDLESATAAIRDVDLLVHCAAIHPWKQYTDDEYLGCNIVGAHHAFAAAAANGIARVVYTSSVAAMGFAVANPDRPIVTEDSQPCRPVENLYCVTKHVGEQFCRLFHRSHGIKFVMLRPPTFIPYEDECYRAMRLLWNQVDVRDLVQAHVRAVDADHVECDAFITSAPTPFQLSDFPELRTDPVSVIERYHPGARALFEERGVKVPQIDYFYSHDKATRELGYQPEYGFGRYLECVKKGEPF